MRYARYDDPFREYEAPSKWRVVGRWALIGFFITVAALACLWMTGCGGFKVFNPSTWIGGGSVPKGNPPSDDSGSFATLLDFAKWSYMPGVGILALSVLAGIASNWFPPLKALADLWRLGMTLLILGLGIAALPWGLHNFGQPAIWITLGFAVIVGGIWVYGHRKKIAKGDIL